MKDDSALRGYVDPKAKSAVDSLFDREFEETEAAPVSGAPATQRTSESYSAPVAMSAEQQAQAKQTVTENHAPVRAAVQRAKTQAPAIATKYDEATEDFETDTAKALSEQKKILDEQVKPLIKQADTAQSKYQEAVDKRVEYRAEVQDHIEKMDILSKQIASQQPRNIWTDASVPVKIAGIAAMALGGAAQAIWGDKTNAATDMIEAAVKQDLTMQRLRMEKNKDDYANQGFLLKQFMVEGDHIENAEDKAFSTAMMGISGRLKNMMPLLKDPEMRMKLTAQIAELDMKAAASNERVMIQTAGFDARQAEAEAAAKDHATTSSARATAAQSNASVRQQHEDRMGRAEANKEQSMMIPHWHTRDGKMPKGSAKEVQELREMETSVRNATTTMDDIVKDVGKGDFLTDPSAWQKLSSDMGRATVKLKGKGIVNAGANFTQLEKDLIAQGYLASDSKIMLKVLDKNALKLIRRAQADLWNDVHNAMAERNFDPDDDHDVFTAKGKSDAK